MADIRNTFLASAPNSALDASKVVDMFEALNDVEQNEVEKNLMHIASKTWPETYLWNHIEKNGLRVDRD